MVKIGLGIVTYNRKEFFLRAIKSVEKYLLDSCDVIFVYNDGSDYGDVSFLPKIQYHQAKTNQGVARGKNYLLKQMMDAGCEYMFLMEDDLEILDKKAISGYIAAYRMTGVPHFNFSQHGDNTHMEAMTTQNLLPLVYWPNCVGAWSFYTREAIENVGYFDEHFHNAYEHVEHTYRIYKGHIDYGMYPDVIGSGKWLREQPGALDNSSIRLNDKAWRKNIEDSLAYWRSKDPDCPAVDPNFDNYIAQNKGK